MILYLLAAALLLGVDSHTANVTGEELWGNQTFSKFPDNNRSRNGDELQINQTSSVITEDDETFQEVEASLPLTPCPLDLFESLAHGYCGERFRSAMFSEDRESWCDLDIVIWPYNELTLCLEYLSRNLACHYPNPLAHDVFLLIHSEFFQNCSKVQPQFDDAPDTVVMVFTLLPVSLIPVLVYLVIWKSKVQD